MTQKERTEPVPRHYGDWHGWSGCNATSKPHAPKHGALRIAAARAGCACDGRSKSGPSETGGISDVFKEDRCQFTGKSRTNWKVTRTQDCFRLRTSWRKNSTSVVNECNEKMLELSQAFEKIARDSAQNMIASATDEGNKNLEEKLPRFPAFQRSAGRPCSQLSRIHWGID